jgi:hypothetical protein
MEFQPATWDAVQAAKMLVEPTQALTEQIESVDFPSRLDKLDATYSAGRRSDRIMTPTASRDRECLHWPI